MNRMNHANFDWYMHTMLFLHTQEMMERINKKAQKDEMDVDENGENEDDDVDNDETAEGEEDNVDLDVED